MAECKRLLSAALRAGPASCAAPPVLPLYTLLADVAAPLLLLLLLLLLSAFLVTISHNLSTASAIFRWGRRCAAGPSSERVMRAVVRHPS